MTFSNSQRKKIIDNKKLLPPLSEGPFGSFPACLHRGRYNAKMTRLACINENRESEKAKYKKGSETEGQVFSKMMLVSHTGAGGMTASTLAKQQATGCFPHQNGEFGDPRGPDKTGVFCKQKIPPTEFRRHYERGDLPLCIQHAAKRTLQWKVDVGMLDYHYYLPILIDGLRELEEPYSFVALQGTIDLLTQGGAKILPTIPQLIVPLKMSLDTRHPEILEKAMNVLQRLLVSGDYIGQALVPYYRQLLPVFNIFKNSSKNKSDHMDLAQNKRHDLFRIIDETLNMLEKYGGEDAFINIKYLIPTYESCM